MTEATTIDIRDLPTAERDQTLGAYMESWSRVERLLLSLTHLLLRSDFGVARTVFSTISGNAQLRELLLSLGQSALSTERQQDLERMMERLKTLATRRNRIVHGEWIAHLDNPRSPTRFSHWIRHYHASDHQTFIGALTGDNQKAASNYSFSLGKIAELSEENYELASRIEAFLGLFSERERPTA